jgi:phosphate uptake regulator
MKRKVIQIADSTQLVSIPRKWGIAHNLKKGDELEVKEEGNTLIISTGKIAEAGTVEVDVTGMERDTLMFLVRALYKNGYDEVVLNFKNNKTKNLRTGESSSTMEIISKEVSRLNGMEIFKQKPNQCTIRSLSDESSKVFDTMLRRVFILTLEAIDDLRKGFKEGDDVLLESIQQKHDTITRFVVYSQRLLHKLGDPKHRRTDVLYHILEVIDELMDLIKFSARDLLKYKISPSKRSIKIYDKVHESFELYYKLFYHFNIGLVTQINTNRYEILNMLVKSANILHKKELMVLTNMEQVTEKILNLTVSTMSFKH